MKLPSNIESLIEKYSRPGPRYTSYPTAPHFTESIDFNDLQNASNEANGPVSLYIHIPFCKSNCWFCGCNTIITSKNKWADDYLTLLEKEIELIHRSTRSKRKVSQIHLGGGTPNFLNPEQITRLFEIVNNGFEVETEVELSVEFAPNYLTQEQVTAFANAGLTRASFGIQDTQLQVQEAINRVQPAEKNRAAMEMLRSAGVESINIDLIYGLPLQSKESYAQTLEEVLALQPDRFAIFNYAHVPHMKPFQKKLESHPMPTPNEKIAMLLFIIKTLGENGFGYIGMDHFGKPDDELHIAQKEHRLHRNFQGYTVQEEKEIIGLGISSISETPRSYRQNFKDYESYQQSIEREQWPIARGIILSEEDALRRAVIQSVMCNLKLDPNDFGTGEKEQVCSFIQNSEKGISELEADGLLNRPSSEPGSAFEVTESGRLFLRNIAMLFDAYLGIGNAKFSKTV